MNSTYYLRTIRYENNIEIATSPYGFVDNRDLNLCPGAGSCWIENIITFSL